MTCLRFTPWASGLYSVAPALKPFGADFGNGELDLQFFPQDEDTPRFLANKRACLTECPAKYVGSSDLPKATEEAVAAWVARHSNQEGGLDALMANVHEDLAIVQTENGQDRIAYLHLCAPSHWRMRDKIGRSFFETHAPVPGIERVNAGASGLVRAMVYGRPRVRFVWTLETDRRPNHHPDPPPGHDAAEWYGRRWSEDRPWTVRWERQTTVGFPEQGAAVFLIRVGFTDPEGAEERASLAMALRSMPLESRRYKGLTNGAVTRIIAELENRNP